MSHISCWALHPFRQPTRPHCPCIPASTIHPYIPASHSKPFMLLPLPLPPLLVTTQCAVGTPSLVIGIVAVYFESLTAVGAGLNSPRRKSFGMSQMTPITFRLSSAYTQVASFV